MLINEDEDRYLDWCAEIEQGWRQSLPRTGLVDLIRQYAPQSVPIIKNQIKELKQGLESTLRMRQEADDNIRKLPYSERANCAYLVDLFIRIGFLTGTLGEDAIHAKIKKYETALRVYQRQQSEIKNQDIESPNRVTDDDIAQAKATPILEVYDPGRIRRSGNKIYGPCPIHKEAQGSFTVYTDQNTWWCYGACGTGGDVIKLIQMTNECTFIEAVRILVHKN